MRKTHLPIGLLFLIVNLFTFHMAGAEGINSAENDLNQATFKDLVASNYKIKSSVDDWASTSVLANGNWVKIQAEDRGIYKISFSQLQNWGFSDPEAVCLYGNGGYMLSKQNSDPVADDLIQNPVWYGKDKNSADCLFFYSSGTVEWTYYSSVDAFKHTGNDYSDVTYFYLSDQGTPLVVSEIESTTDDFTDDASTFLDYQLYENDLENLIQSGRRWFGEKFQQGQSREFEFSVTNPVTTQAFSIYTEAAGRSSLSSAFSIYYNDVLRSTISISSVDTSDPITQYANVGQSRMSISSPQASSVLRFDYSASNSSALGWLDYIELNAYRYLTMDGSSMNFRVPASAGSGKITRFNLNGAQTNLQIWDVSDFLNPLAVAYNLNSSVAQFTLHTDDIREFVAFYPNGEIPSAEKVDDIANQDLHQMEIPDMIIITHPDFATTADELASFHLTKDNLNVAVVEPEQIYNEFSCGLPDVSGIRNFLRYCYEKSNDGNGKLKYVLLLGDGTYDNKNILGEGLNFIPTYQSENSLLPTASFVTDDFFVLLDSDEGEYDGLIDLGIGRIPAKTTDEAETVVDKVMNYVSSVALGEWRNRVCFIGDDEDSNTHMTQADQLAENVSDDMPAVAVGKIYFDAYEQVSTPSGDQYPDVTDAINSSVKDGVLIMNYTGHANETALAGEKVLTVSDIDEWTNYNKLPVFVTATCEFSRFDGDEQSGGEHILFNENGGGIALFSSTRVVYSNPNFLLNSNFYEQVFQRDENGDYLRMGDVMKRTKNATLSGVNKRNFTLLGDPALRLSIPQYNVVTTTINGVEPAALVDPIAALSKVTVTGEVVDTDGNLMSDFNGELVPVVYDKKISTETLGNGGETPFEYEVQNNRIYRGVSSVVDGKFEFSFIVPKDISYAIGEGKILYYASNDSIDAHGANNELLIGGNSESDIVDTEGPLVELYLNNPSFESGDQVGVNSILYLNLSDESGINTLGTGIGHDITAVLDGDYSDVIVLNDYYLADLDSYTSGTIVYPMSGLSVGEHTLTIKVWDVMNNSTEIEIHFVVSEEFKIEDVICYPNPMTDYTRFKIIHNRPGEVFDAKIEVFDSKGSLIDMIKETLISEETETDPILWQLSDHQVLVRSGAYLYRVILSASDGNTATKSGVIILLKR
ncbi:type IX secretion system sortase PorU [Mangrovibacterium diazotrophicum]|uniref:Peptidase C25-like protein n=1 Tax=Mangrovibacterium diazotrophicum TaxID=1261403 RepID=A0A419VXE2_9BACT|nr:type IX secretion system sortase PorU [Mangrovibacterium diazotrophicum]RKD87750.1 peptidase C25-like protein [Mangrovibacterium diazotrophicum]